MKTTDSILGNVRVWVTVSTALFMTCWFLPVVDGCSAAAISVNFINHYFNSPTGEKLQMLGLAIFIFGIISAIIGWMLQFPVRSMTAWFLRGEKNTPSEADSAETV